MLCRRHGRRCGLTGAALILAVGIAAPAALAQDYYDEDDGYSDEYDFSYDTNFGYPSDYGDEQDENLDYTTVDDGNGAHQDGYYTGDDAGDDDSSYSYDDDFSYDTNFGYPSDYGDADYGYTGVGYDTYDTGYGYDFYTDDWYEDEDDNAFIDWYDESGGYESESFWYDDDLMW